MKKRIVVFLVAAVTATLLTGCGTPYSKANETLNQSFGNGYFTTVKTWNDENYKYQMMYANDTKVMYLIGYTGSYRFGITPLFNPDGTLQVYGEGE